MILRCPVRDSTPTWFKDFAYSVHLEDRIVLDEIIVDGTKAEYRLVGMALLLGYTYDPLKMIGESCGHIIAAVRAPAGKTVVIDDQTINEYNSWAEVEKLQRDLKPNASKLLPHTLVYRLSTPQKLKDPVGPLLSFCFCR
jgi:hypothetical protein